METSTPQNLTPYENSTGYKILAQQELNHQIKQVIIHAPEIAEKAKAGQFVILRVDDEGERIPLTLVEWEKAEGTITQSSKKSASHEHVCIICRRSREEMSARKEELLNAEEEGITCKFLATPTRFIGDEQGNVKGIELVAMELGEPDASGRRKSVPVQGSETVIDVDTVIVAIGRTPNPIIQSVTKGLETTPKGTIIADEETGKTSLEGVYTGGDIMTGEATVISAMGAGKRAAKAIHEYLLRKSSERSTAQVMPNLPISCKVVRKK